MMIRESLRKSTYIVVKAAGPVFSQRTFIGDTKILDEKEKGDERIFFKRQEGKLFFKSFTFIMIDERLRELREKLGSQGQDAK